MASFVNPKKIIFIFYLFVLLVQKAFSYLRIQKERKKKSPFSPVKDRSSLKNKLDHQKIVLNKIMTKKKGPKVKPSPLKRMKE